jgi:hypothetical protein
MKLHHLAALWIILLMAGLPASTNYSLQSYGVGSGGVANSTSSNYRVNGLTGQTAGKASSTNYKGGFGFDYHLQGNVPTLTLTNDDNWYDKLHMTLDPAGNPTPTKFVIEISTDSFATVEYVANDFTVSPTLSPSYYLTYAGWGASSGVILRGLAQSTVYSVRAKALVNDAAFTETGIGPPTSGATVNMQMSFRLDVASTYTSTSPPYVVSMGSVLAGSVVTANDKIWATLSTNADNGAYIYGNGQYGGLHSSITGHTIASGTVNLATQSEGFGLQDVSATQTGDGPLVKSATYNVSGTNVAKAFTDLAELFNTSGAPVWAGVGEIAVLAKSSLVTPSSQDYTETLTIVAAGSF